MPTVCRMRLRPLVALMATVAVVAVAVAVLAGLAVGAVADEERPEQSEVRNQETGEVVPIDQINPSSLGLGLVGLFTDARETISTESDFSAAVALEPDDEGQLRVAEVCDPFAGQVCDGLAVPEDGKVVAAEQAGDPDQREDLVDGFAEGHPVEVVLAESSEASREYDFIDPTPEENEAGAPFPGVRGPDQLIIYTPEFGDTTGTNEFGEELVVDGDDRVVEVGGFDSPIPDDGFVVSGQGGQGEWLVANAVEGSLVEVDEDTGEVTLIVDVEAYLSAAEADVDRAREAVDERGDVLDIDPDARDHLATAEQRLANAEQAAEDSDIEQAVFTTFAASAAADQAWIATRTSREAEGRAIWVRPDDDWTTREDVEEQVEGIAEAGLDTMFLETFFQGWTIYDSDVVDEAGIEETQRPAFADADVDALELWTDVADEYDVEVHAWVHTFFVGNPLVQGDNPGPVLDANPDWGAIPRELAGDEPGDDPRDPADVDDLNTRFDAPAEQNYRFIDPANEDARAFLLDLFEEMVVDYDLDGLHLDYIRYPISEPVDSELSYGTSRETFDEDTGVDPLDLEPDDEAFADWQRFREQQVTSFVAETQQRLEESVEDELDKRVPLSAAVFPDLEGDAQPQKFQRWDEWSEQGLVDVLAGMSFGTSPEANVADTQEIRERTEGDDTLIYLGNYAPFNATDPVQMLQQNDAIREAGGHGIAYFSHLQISDAQLDALGDGSFRDETLPPHADPQKAAVAGIERVADRIDEVHARGLPGRSERALVNELDAALRALERADRGPAPAAEQQLDQAEQQLDQAEQRLENAQRQVEQRAEPVLADELGPELRHLREVLAAAR